MTEREVKYPEMPPRHDFHELPRAQQRRLHNWWKIADSRACEQCRRETVVLVDR